MCRAPPRARNLQSHSAQDHPLPLSLSLCGALCWTWMCIVHCAPHCNKQKYKMHERTLRTTLDEMLIALNFNEMGCVGCWSSICSTVKCGVYSVHCALYTVLWYAMYSVHTICVHHCALYTLHCAQCAVHDSSAADPWCHPNPRHQTRASYYQPPTTIAAHTRPAEIPLSCYATKA